MRLAYKPQQGFTIIELLIVVVIIAVLATVVVVAYNGIQQRAIKASFLSDMGQASTQLSVYSVDHEDTFPDDLTPLNGGNGLKFKTVDQLLYTAYNEEDPANFCITAVLGELIYNVTRLTEPTAGYCPDHVPLGAPAQPTISTTVNSSSQITVAWEAVEDADTYNLEYSTADNFSPVSTIQDITGLSQAVTGLQPNTLYYFRLYAENEAGTSSASNVAEDTTLAPNPPGAPVLTPTANSPSQITVTWPAVSGATAYRIEYSTSSTFTTLTALPNTSSTTQVISSGLSAGTRYYLRGYAITSGVDSAASATVNAITTINAPDSPTVSVAIPGSARSASSGPWAKDYNGDPTSGNWYYASGAVSSSTCASGTTRQQRARVQYNSPTTWGAWTGYTTSSTFYAIGPLSGYGIRFQVQTRCYTSVYTSAGSTSGYGCRWRSTNSTSCSGF